MPGFINRNLKIEMQPECRTCRHWHFHGLKDDQCEPVGECQRFPPDTDNISSEVITDKLMEGALFPKTTSSMECGEYKRAKPIYLIDRAACLI